MIEIAGVPSALVRPKTEVAQAPRPEEATLEGCCFTVLHAEWSTLALVATEPAAPSRAIAAALVDAARSYRLGQIRVLDATGDAAADVARLVDDLAAPRGEAGRVVVTVPHPSAACGPILVAVDAVLLLVRLGASRLRAVREAMELAGRARVLGCVVVR
jgi:hypothetical protein